MYLNPQDYQVFLNQNDRQEPIYVKAKTMILKLEPLEGIAVGEFGASAL